MDRNYSSIDACVRFLLQKMGEETLLPLAAIACLVTVHHSYFLIIDRKNWLFTDTPKGRTPVQYSNVETAKANERVLYDCLIKC
ncbi:hypothetical protein FWP48_09685 [Vibrio parahaemolyticus]|nr:hypothetical protein [Vibrio parahaemolyticus]